MSTTDTAALPNAFVTLLNSSSYLPGALVLCHALNDLHPHPREIDFQTVCIVTPETVDVGSIKQLRQAFDVVIGVEVITSGVEGEDGLNLMGRPDLHSALTKLHIFRLQQYFRKVVYLDADVLPLRPISHLFKLPEHFYASPDIGWPDCFNSGVMVFTPRQEDFDGMMGVMKAAREGKGPEGLGIGSGNGSFDGADQGLLNEWFSEEGGGGDWNRLSFTYNATPSAAYTYLPAYQRYGSKIKCVHFIGNNKPWRSISTRPARAPVPTDQGQNFDYPALVDKWFAVYDKHLRPMGEPVQTQTFSVPENVAVWNRPALASVEGRADLQELQKRQKAKKRVSFLGHATEAEQQQLSGYLSLPLDGRIDLMRPQPMPDIGKPDVEAPAESLPSASASPPITTQALPSQLPVNPPVERADSPPAVWDARYSAPPQRSGAQYGEMRAGVFDFYENAWDKPLGQHEENDWNPANSYPVIPDSVKQDKWYAGAADVAPDRSKVKDVFPWEKESRPAPARRFPKGDTPPPTEMTIPLVAVQSSTPPNQTPAIERGSRQFFDAAPPPIQRHTSFAEAMRSGSYRNAWDDVPAINKYVARHGSRPSLSSLEGPLNPGVKNVTLAGLSGPSGTEPGRKSSKGKERDDHQDRRSQTSRDGDDEDTESSAEETYLKRPIKTRHSSGIHTESGGRQVHSRQHSTSSVGTQGSSTSKRGQARQQQGPTGPSGSPEAPGSQSGSTPRAQRPVYARDSQGDSSLASDVTPVASRRTSSETLIAGAPASSTLSPSLPTIASDIDNATSTVDGTTPLSAPRRVGRVFDPSTDIDMRRKDTLDALARGMKRMGSNATP
ncbi:hypothetical protein NliqN6_0295 [Naganishia liquefaciens]|uniref:Glycosyltransferase family 8 protein n=1 Tax=Naganishia liquefaciens TaxID=104408 RepID=A0A8H3TMR7_9TREE|nr:hypothetical protein NliqN6_0295 [Naganishia liquefaciens]